MGNMKTRRFIWLWEVYTAFFMFFIMKRSISLFSPSAKEYYYWEVLISFNSYYLFPLLLESLQLVFMTLTGIALILFLYKKYLFNARFWQYAFILRAILDVCTHKYALNTFHTIHDFGNLYFTLYILFQLVCILPSYLAFFLYAFIEMPKAQKELSSFK